MVPHPGGPEQMRIAQTATPRPGGSEVLIRVLAAGVNRPDIQQRKGAYPPPPGASPILGLEAAGEIVACGAGVTELCRRRPRHRFVQWRRLCRVCRGAGDAVPALAAGL